MNCVQELGRVKSDLNLTTYTKQGVEERLAGQYAPWFKNQSQAQAALQIFEDVYSKFKDFSTMLKIMKLFTLFQYRL